jgi:hypothetical protein
MKPDVKEKIDAICRKWAEDSGEPFTILVARHGVIVTEGVPARRKTERRFVWIPHGRDKNITKRSRHALQPARSGHEAR